MSDEAQTKSGSLDDRDVQWMRKIATGDTEAFRELIEAHQTRIIGTVAKMLGSDSDAEDIAQQVFIRVWRSAHRYQPTAKFTTWLFKITRNLVFNELRRKQRHPAASLDVEEAPVHAPDLQTLDPAESMLDVEMQDAIQAAIDSLPEVQRMAIVLRRYEEMAYEDIAAVLGLTVPAVKSVLFRARTDLREKLRRYLDPDA